MDYDLDLLFKTWTLRCRGCGAEFEAAWIPSSCPRCSLPTRIYWRPASNRAADWVYALYGIPSGRPQVAKLVVELWKSLDERDVDQWRELLLQVDIEELACELESESESEYHRRRAATMRAEWRSGRYAARVELLLTGLAELLAAEQARHAKLASGSG